MTNFEKYKDEILEISKETKVAVDKTRNTPTRCPNISCKKCLFYPRCDEETFVKWLYAEHREPAPMLTKEERVFCEIVRHGYIARDKDGSLCVYDSFPVQRILSWFEDLWIKIDPDTFRFITWESGKVWSIESLLKLEVEE